MADIYVTTPLPKATLDRMRALFGERIAFGTGEKHAERIKRAAKGARILVSTLGDPITAEVIDALSPELGLIANYGAGLDHIDVAHALHKKIKVSNTPSVLTDDTADATMTLLLAVPRRVSEGAAAIRHGDWSGWNPTYLLGRRITGKALGLVGMGHIGQAVARRAKGFGLRIYYHQRERLHASVEAELGVVFYPQLEDMLADVDFVSLHCPHTPETHHMINGARLARMKPTAYIINTARGALIDEVALIQALDQGKIAGAGLDVFEHAPHVPDGLKNRPNVIALPHISSATIESRQEMGERVIINIQSFLDGHQPPNRVLLEDVT
jgi:glyoxylate reductase